MSKSIKSLALFAALLPASLAVLHAQQISVVIDPTTTRYIEGTTELNRPTYFNTFYNIDLPNVKTQARYDRLVKDNRMEWGSIQGVMTTAYGGWSYPEDPNRPGFVDQAQLLTRLNSRRYEPTEQYRNDMGNRIELISHDAYNQHPSFMGQYSLSPTEHSLPLNIDAAAELYALSLRDGFSDFNRPEWLELINEPHFIYWDDQHFADLHTRTRTAVKALTPQVEVGGPCLPVAHFYASQYDSFSHLSNFIDNTNCNLDFYSFHVYDFLHNEVERPNDFSGRVTSGLPLESVLDLIQNYTVNKYSKKVDIGISETGGYGALDRVLAEARARIPGEGTFEWEMKRRSIVDFNMVNSLFGNMLAYMDHPDTVKKACPFVMLETMSWNPQFYATLYVPNNYTDKNDWVETKMIHFYQMFRDLQGRRVAASCPDPDVQTRAFVDGNTAFVVMNNLSNFPKSVALNMPAPTTMKIRRHGRNADLTPYLTEVDQAPVTSLALQPREAVVIRAEYGSPIVQQRVLNEISCYGNKVISKLTSASPTASITVNVPNLAQVDHAWLRVGVSRPLSGSPLVNISLNGNPLVVPLEESAERLTKVGGDYASCKLIRLTPAMLQATNTVTVSFPDGNDGAVGSVVIRAAYNVAPPTLVATNIVDDQGEAAVEINAPVSYTLTFSQDIDSATVSAADFGNAGTSTVTFGAITETSPGVFTVVVTPTSSGTLQLRVNAGAVINNAVGIALMTTAAIPGSTTINVNSASNAAPVWTANPLNEVNAAEGVVYNSTLADNASDSNGNTLTFTKVSGPAWLSVASNGTLSGTPTNSDVGANSFRVSVSDGIAPVPVFATLKITVTSRVQITALTPADNEINVAVGVNLVATFNEPIAIGTGSITIRNLTDGTETVITLPNAQVNASGSVLTINPTADLTGAKDYSIRIGTNAIKGLDGSFFGGITNDTTWSFSLFAASTWTYNGTNATNNTWTSAGSWSGGRIAGGSNVTANFILDITAARAITLGGAHTIGKITFTDTASSHNLSLADNTLTFDVTSGTPVIDVTQPDRTLTIDSIIAGSDGLTKTGLGTLAVSGANTYTGATTVSQGTVNVLDTTNGLKSSSSLSIATGATVNVTGTSSIMTGNWTIAGTLNKTDGAPQWFWNPVTLNNGTISGALDSATYGTFNWAGTTINANGSSNAITAFRLGMQGGNSFHTPLATDALSVSSILGGNDAAAKAGTLTKRGLGTVSLTGANIYTGFTTVSTGKLFINGNQSIASGNVTVSATATLGGTGVIGGNTTIAANGKLEFNLSTNPASHDKLELAAGKSLTFSGASTLTITGTTGATPGVYTLLTAPGGITGVPPATLTLPRNWVATVSISGNNLLLNVTSADSTAPTLVGIVDDKGGSSIVANTTVNYTVTFSEDIDAASVTSADFGNAGSSSAIFGAITETSPGVFTVAMTPTSAGTLRLRINAGVQIADIANNTLNTTAAIPDDTTINVTNDAPVWTGNPLNEVSATEDAVYDSTLADSASDGDGHPLTFTKVSGPAWLSVATSGVLSGTPTNSDVGANSFTVSVSDGFSEAVQATLNITVTNINDAPTFTTDPILGGDATEDLAYSGTLAGKAIDVDAGATLTYAKVNGPSWLSVAATGVLSGTPSNSDLGENSFTVSVSDGIAPAVQATLNISVKVDHWGPYSADSNTLHLWHLNAAVVPAADSVTTDALSLAVLGGGATLANAGYTGFGTALSTFDGGTGAAIGTGTDAYLAPLALVDGAADNVAWSFADPTTGAFTYEALVRFDFNPLTTQARTNSMMILSGDNDPSGGGVRSFQFRLEPKGANPFADGITTPLAGPALHFISVRNAASGQVENKILQLPTTGTHAVAQGVWFHVAITYTGNEGIANNLKFYWTKVDPTFNGANLLGNKMLTRDLSTGQVDFAIGQGGRSPSQANFVGAIDEVRISKVARSEYDFIYGPDTVNDAPVFTVNPIAGANATEDTPYSGTLVGTATDLDATATQTYSKVSGPSWLSVAATGALSGTPSNSDVGENSFTVSVSDGIAPAVQATLNITVTNTYDAPVFTADPILGGDATEDLAYSGTLAGNVTDVDAGATLTYAKVNGPSWLSVSATGALSGTPSNSDVGENSFTVSVSDGIAPAAETTLEITVINTNDAPVFTANPIAGANGTEDAAYTGTLAGMASDVDADTTLAFAKVSGPAWLSVASNGTLSGTPTNSDVGANSFTLSVSDGIAPAVQATLNITVTSQPKIISLIPVDNASGVALGADLVATFSEPIFIGTGTITIRNLTDGTESVITLPDAQVTASGSVLTINPTADLLGGKHYAVRIGTNAIKSLADNFFGGITDDTTWSFSILPASTWTYDGTDATNNTWTTAGSWSGGNIAGGSNFTANFILDITAARTITLGGDHTIGKITFTDTASSHDLSLANNTLTFDVTTGAPVIDVTQSDRTLTIDCIIAGNDGLTKTGLGTLAVSGANTYTGATTVSQGTLNVLDSTNGLKSSNSLSIAAGATANVTGTSSIMTGNWTIAGTLNKTDGASQWFWNPVTLNNGTISGAVDSATYGTFNWAGITINANGSSNAITAFRLGMQGSNQVNTPLITDALSISSILGGNDAAAKAGTLLKRGLGTLTLTGANIYTGTTSVTFGKLFINGNQSTASGNVTVSANATLGGTGVIGGNTTIAANGKLEFNLTTASASHDKLELAAGKSLTFSGASALTITGTTAATPGIYTLLTAPGGITGLAPASLTLPSNWVATVSISGNDLVLNLTSNGVADNTAPTLVGILDDTGGSSIDTNTTVNYTVTFSEDINAASVSSADFNNAGSSSVNLGAITETSPGVFTVAMTPTSAGTLRLQINAGAVITDIAGNALNTTSAIPDDTTIIVNALNVAPAWASNPVNEVNANEDAAYSATLANNASDANGNTLTFTKVSGPSWLSVAASGALTGTPTNSNVGPNSFTVSVSDGIAPAVQAQLNITVVVPRNLHSSGAKTWNSTTANWGLVTGGPYNTATWSSGDSAIFEGTVGTVTLGEAIHIKNLTFTNTAGTYTITGSTLNFTAGTILTNSVNNGTIIQSNITGAPAVNAFALATNEYFTFKPAANGSMVLGAITGNGGTGAGIMSFQGGAGSNSTVASVNGPKSYFEGSGTWTLTGLATSYANEIKGTGTVIVSTGTLQANNRSTSLISGTLHYNNPAAVRDNNSNTGGDNDFRLRGGSIDNTSSAAITTSTWNPNMTMEADWTFIGSNGAASNLFLGNGGVILTGTRQVSVQNAATTLSFGGVISGSSFGLTKAGAGTLELRGANTYTGPTIVSAGTLRINGSTSASSAVTVNGGNLGGTGTIGGNVTVAASGNLAPGVNAGTLNITGNLALSAMASGAGTLKIGLNALAGSNDRIAVGGSLALGTLALDDLAVTNLGGLQAGTYTLITSTALTGTVSGSTAVITTGFNGKLQTNGNNLELVVTISPAAVSFPPEGYVAWAEDGGVFNADDNGDGVANGIAWLLGMADPSENALNILPAASHNGTHLRLTFRCLKSTMRNGTSLKIQSSNDCGASDPWTSNEAEVPDVDATINGVVFDTTDDGDYIHVIADIPTGGAKLFGRLSAAPAP